MKSILVVTSLSPHNVEKQLPSFVTWKPIGSRLVSLNHREEYETVRAAASGIEVVPIDVSAKGILGKPFVFIDSFLEYFKSAPESHLIIVNSDIYLTEPDRMRAILEQANVDLLFGQRVDVEAIDSTSGDLFGGFDYFMLSKSGAAMYPKSQFCMGAPWWDHWMPIVPLVLGRSCQRCDEPIALHVKHSTNWGIKPLSFLGYHMAEQLSGLWAGAADRLIKADSGPEATAIYQFGYFFVKYFLERRKLYFRYHDTFDQLPEPLKGEVSWDMTDVYPLITLDFIMKFAPKFSGAK